MPSFALWWCIEQKNAWMRADCRFLELQTKACKMKERKESSLHGAPVNHGIAKLDSLAISLWKTVEDDLSAYAQ